MKKIEPDFFEYLLGDTMTVFDIPVPAKFTWQQLYFTNLAYEKFGVDNSGFSQLSIDSFKELFLLWQNKSNPSLEWVNESIKGEATILDFSHDLDYSWNSLDKPILMFCSIHIPEIGCKTYQESLKEEFLGWNE